MESISSLVKRIIDSKPFIHESMIKGIVSYGNLADILIPEIEHTYIGVVKQSAVVMALRRYGDELRQRELESRPSSIGYEITIKTKILDVNVEKCPKMLEKLSHLYSIVSIAKGDFLNITIGSNEIGIAISQKYTKALEELLENENILHYRKDLVALTVIFSGDFLHTPGIVYEAVRKLAWEHINVLELVSTMNELTFVIDRKDSTQAYEALQVFL